MKWFHKHPELIQKLREKISTSIYYTERCHSISNFFISTGEIKIHFNGVNRFPITIIFPNCYPFTLPMVFSLKEVLSDNELTTINKEKSLKKAINHIRTKAQIYNIRHQGVDGSLCLVELDNLHKDGIDQPDFEELMKRTKDWFQGHFTNVFPQDNLEVELFSHFHNKSEDYKFLFYKESFNEKEFIKGIIYLIPLFSIEKKVFIAQVSQSYNSSKGIIENLNFDTVIKLGFLPKEINNSADLLTNPKAVTEAEHNKQLIKAYWWHINHEPREPFESFDKLALLIGNRNSEKGYEKLFEDLDFRKSVSNSNKEIFLCLRYINEKTCHTEWISFRLYKKTEVAALICDITLCEFKKHINNYSIEAIYTETLTDEKFYQRNSGRTDRLILKEQAINIIGCGALGSEIADCLAKAGVGKFKLIDKEIFKPQNSVRHLLPISMTGLYKVDGLSWYLESHNPFISTTQEPINILYSPQNRYIEEGISISTIADDNTEGYLNEQALLHEKTIFYSRALRGGKAARIFRVEPRMDACKNCLGLYRREQSSIFFPIPEDPNLPTITNECNNPIRPASAADLKLIASLTSLIIIDYLQNQSRSIKKNHWIWSTEELNHNKTTVHPYSLYSDFIKPHPDCKYCQEQPPLILVIKKDALEKMQLEISYNPRLETGGIILGHKEGRNCFIEFCSPPGPKSEQSEKNFKRDGQFCQSYLEEHNKKYGHKASCLGEWHYHPFENNKPSKLDIKSLDDISIDPNYLNPEPIMIILNNNGEPSCTVHPAFKPLYFTKLSIIE